jgi:phosphate uptake regulator
MSVRNRQEKKVNAKRPWAGVYTERRSVIHSKRKRAPKSVSHLVTLPIEWVKKMKLEKKGAQVDVTCFYPDNHFLNLVPAGFFSNREQTTISGNWPANDMSDEESLKLDRKILSAYLVGYERICVKNRSGPISRNLRASISNFVQSKMPGAKVARALAKPNKVEIQVDFPARFSLKKQIENMRGITVRMHREAMNLMKEFDAVSADTLIRTMDDEVDALCHETVRFCKLAAQNPLIVLQLGMQNYRDLMGYRVISRRIERCADHANRMICDLLNLFREEKMIKFDPELKEAIEEYSGKVIRIFGEAIEALFSSERDYELADNVIDKVENVAGDLDDLIKRHPESCTPEELYCQRRMLVSLKRTAEYTKTIAEVTCNMYTAI